MSGFGNRGQTDTQHDYLGVSGLEVSHVCVGHVGHHQQDISGRLISVRGLNFVGANKIKP